MKCTWVVVHSTDVFNLYEALARYTWRNFSVKYQARSEARLSHTGETCSTGGNNRQRDKTNVMGADEHIEQAASVERSEEMRKKAQEVELSTRNVTLFTHASLPTVPSQKQRLCSLDGVTLRGLQTRLIRMIDVYR